MKVSAPGTSLLSVHERAHSIHLDYNSALEPDQCCAVCLCCKGRCGFFSVAISAALQVMFLLVAGWMPFIYGIVGYVPALIVLPAYHYCRGRRATVDLDLCFRMLLLGSAASMCYTLGTMAIYLPMLGYMAVCLAIVSTCVLSCYVFVRDASLARARAEEEMWNEQSPEFSMDLEEDVEPEERRIPCGPRRDRPLLVEDGGPLEDLNFPGFYMPSWTGLGTWKFSGNRLGWVLVFVLTMGLLGMCGGLMELAGQALMLQLRSHSGVVGAMFIKAFFRNALTQEACKYVLLCTARGVRRNRRWGEDLIALSLWASTGFATFDTFTSIMRYTSSDPNAKETAVFVSLMSVPAQLLPGLVSTFGLLGMYTVRSGGNGSCGSMGSSVVVLLLHLLCAIIMHALYDWVVLLSGVIPSVAVYTIGSLILLLQAAITYGLLQRWQHLDASWHGQPVGPVVGAALGDAFAAEAEGKSAEAPVVGDQVVVRIAECAGQGQGAKVEREAAASAKAEAGTEAGTKAETGTETGTEAGEGEGTGSGVVREVGVQMHEGATGPGVLV